MFKKIMFRGTAGFVLGVFIANLFCLISSTIFGNDGSYTPIARMFIDKCQTEIGAAWLMFLLSGSIGFICSASSIFFENDNLNLLMQTIIHFIINAPSMFLIGWICYWMPHNTMGIIIWIIEYLLIYAIIWLSFYLSYKKKVAQINEALMKEQNISE